MDLILKNKTAIITGGSGGIGFATAKIFLQQGAQVMLVDLNEDALKQAVQKLESAHVAYCPADVSSESDTKNYVQKTLERFGGVDILFANAGIEGQAGSLCDITEANFDKVFNVNVKGVWLAIKHTAGPIAKKGGGSMIITSSVAGMRGSANLGPYVTSKHALVGLMRVASAELGSKNIRVNTINPGPVDNRMMRSIEKQFSNENPEAVKAAFVTKIPLGRYAQNDEIADMALFLASNQSRYCSGGLYTVDGGFTST